MCVESPRRSVAVPILALVLVGFVGFVGFVPFFSTLLPRLMRCSGAHLGRASDRPPQQKREGHDVDQRGDSERL